MILTLVPLKLAMAEPLQLTTLNYRPYSYLLETEVTGINTEIIRELFKRAKIDIEISVKPWARVLKEARTGKTDAIYNPLYTKERAVYLDYILEPLFIEKVVLISIKGFPVKFNGTFRSIKNQRVGTVRSFSLGPKMDAAFQNGTIQEIEAKSTETILKMLLARRIPFIASDQATIMSIANQMSVAENIVSSGPAIELTPTHLAFSKGKSSQKLRNKLSNILKGMKLDGSIKGITRKYGLLQFKN